MRDKLWFYFTYKYEDFKRYVASSTFPDGSRAFVQGQGNYSAVTRLTWAATSRDKVRFYLDRQFNGEDYNGFNTLPTTTPEASTDAYGRGWVPQLKWTQTTSNKLLLDAGISYYTQGYEQSCRPDGGTARPAAVGTDHQPSVGRLRQHDSALHELDEELQRRRVGQLHHRLARHQDRHDDAVGYQLAHVLVERADQHAGLQRRALRLSPPAPRTRCRARSCRARLAVVVENTPATGQQKVKRDIGLFVQDTWTMRRLTLNLGGRYDHFNAEVPAQASAAGPWIQARDFPAIKNVPNWHDWSVRTGRHL